MNMLKECLLECMMFPLCLIDNCIYACSSILFHEIFKLVHVHGRLSRSDKASSRVLYADRRHGDVTTTNKDSNIVDIFLKQVFGYMEYRRLSFQTGILNSQGISGNLCLRA